MDPKAQSRCREGDVGEREEARKETGELESQSGMYRPYKGWEGVRRAQRQNRQRRERRQPRLRPRLQWDVLPRSYGQRPPQSFDDTAAGDFVWALRSHPSGFIAKADFVLSDSSVRCRAGPAMCAPLDQGW